jgi:carbonic anhydrase
MRQPLLIRVVLCTSVLLMSSAAQDQHSEHSWDYGEALGPRHWGDLKPDFGTCKTGHRQSPINVREVRQIDLPRIHFVYRPSPLHVVDNGHTIMVNYESGSFMVIGEKTYALKQFHFHRPSEEQINGKGFDMSVHLVHEDRNGRLAVVAVLLQQGQGNLLIRQLWNHLPKKKEKEEQLHDVQIDLSNILPSDQSYYTFSGSLTTPPCSEDVAWFVLKHPTSISADEIEQFSQYYSNNSRPTQPLYGRTVLESK